MVSHRGLCRPIHLFIWAAMLITLVCGDNTPHSHDTLPIYHLHPEPSDKHHALELGKKLYGISHFKIEQVDSRIILCSGTLHIEVDPVHGGIWTADESRMWNDTLRPKLPDDKEARNIAEKLIAEHHLLPNHMTAPFRLDFGGFSATHLAIELIPHPTKESNTTRENHMLDTRVLYKTTVDIPERGSFHVVGGGGEFQVVLGDGGQLIGFHGVSRRAGPEPFNAKVIPQKEADTTFLDMTKRMKLVEYSSSLAYYLAPAFTKQEFLYPVYLYQGTVLVDGNPVPMSIVTIPATKFGATPFPQPPAGHSTRPYTPYATSTPNSTPDSTHDQATSTPEGRSPSLTPRDPREFGTSWIGTSGGLPASAANAQGFVNELMANGWQMGFNWGDENAWESDWNQNDDSYVDAVDFVFYSGHANGDGWVLSSPDDDFLHVTDVGGSKDRWGEQDCEWIVISACGPLQDDLISAGGGSVFRWQSAFDGLHILLGYGTVTFDNDQADTRVVHYAKGGQRLIDAWLRTGQEVQPATNNYLPKYPQGFPPPNGPTIWVGAMWAESPTANPRNDHIWGHGTVSADPVSPTMYRAMWTTC